MKITRKNNWGIKTKSSKKVCVKFRWGTLTVLDLYFTRGSGKCVLTLFNYTWNFDLNYKVEDSDNTQ